MEKREKLVKQKIEGAKEEVEKWERIKTALLEEGSPWRDSMVIESGGQFYQSIRWELNSENGYVTVQFATGDICPVAYGKWALLNDAPDFFGIERSQIIRDIQPIPDA